MDKVQNPVILKEIKLNKSPRRCCRWHRTLQAIWFGVHGVVDAMLFTVSRKTHHKLPTPENPEGSSLHLQEPDPGLYTETVARLPCYNACGICFPISELCRLLALISHLSMQLMSAGAAVCHFRRKRRVLKLIAFREEILEKYPHGLHYKKK
jgi:hypothetical protein